MKILWISMKAWMLVLSPVMVSFCVVLIFLSSNTVIESFFITFLSLLWLVVAEKSAPAELKESMNLFEEIVTEEQQSKEASYSEVS